MSSLLFLGVLCLALLGFTYGLRRATQLCVLRVERGQLQLLRGRLPPALFSDLAEIVARHTGESLELRILSESGVPRLMVRGSAQPGLAQALRNVLGRYSISQLRAGRLRAS